MVQLRSRRGYRRTIIAQHDSREELNGVAIQVVIGATLIALAPAKQPTAANSLRGSSTLTSSRRVGEVARLQHNE